MATLTGRKQLRTTACNNNKYYHTIIPNKAVTAMVVGRPTSSSTPKPPTNHLPLTIKREMLRVDSGLRIPRGQTLSVSSF